MQVFGFTNASLTEAYRALGATGFEFDKENQAWFYQLNDKDIIANASKNLNLCFTEKTYIIIDTIREPAPLKTLKQLKKEIPDIYFCDVDLQEIEIPN